jgi:hypothetical protein
VLVEGARLQLRRMGWQSSGAASVTIQKQVLRCAQDDSSGRLVAPHLLQGASVGDREMFRAANENRSLASLVMTNQMGGGLERKLEQLMQIEIRRCLI